MDHMIPSVEFPIVMRPSSASWFKKTTRMKKLLKLDAEYSGKEVQDDKAEISEIEIFGITEETSFGEVLEIIEAMGAEPASITQLLFTGLVNKASELGIQVMALRHTVLIEGEEYSFYFDPQDGVRIEIVDEAVLLKAGLNFGIIRRKPSGTIAAA